MCHNLINIFLNKLWFQSEYLSLYYIMFEFKNSGLSLT